MEKHWIRYGVSWSKPLLGAYWRSLFGLVWLMLSAVALSLVKVDFVRRSIDAVLVRDVRTLFVMAGLFVGVTLLKLLHRYVYGRQYEKVFVHMEKDLKNRFAEKLLKVRMGEIVNESSGDLSNRCSTDIPEAMEFIRQGFSNYLLNPLMMLGGFLYLFCYNRKLSLVVFWPIPVLAFLLNRMSGRASNFFGRLQGLKSDYSVQIYDVIHGAEAIRANNLQTLRRVRAGEILTQILKESGRYNINIAITLALIMAVTYVPMALAFLYGAYLVSAGEIGVSLLFGYSQLIGPVCMPVINLFSSVLAMKKSCQSMKRLDAVWQMEEERMGGAALRTEGDTAISFENVSFSYTSDKKVLDGFDLSVEKGKCLGITGGSGAGKSTVADLICGLYETEGGKLRLFGQVIGELALADVRSKVVCVSSCTDLLSGTVLENLRLTSPQADEEEIWQALDKVGMKTFISGLPEGLHSILSEEGGNLSGGQRQRLSLARAFLRKAAIYIFDEPTASLDPEAEEQIVESIAERVRQDGATAVIISHNIRALRCCDEICCLYRGKNAEQGTREELLKRRGVFWRQFRSDVDREVAL